MDFKVRVAKLLADGLGLKTATEIESLLEIPPDNRLGDYALPCFTFAKEMKKAPPLIAKELAAKVKPGGLIGRAEAAGPYLNLFLDKEAVMHETITTILKEKEH